MPTFEVKLADGRVFDVEADKEPTPYELEKAIGATQPVQEPQLDALETSKAGSIAASAARGLTRVLADVSGGFGYLTGWEAAQRAGDSIETGINNTFPVNPIYADDFSVKAAGAVGQAASMLATAGGGGALARFAGGTVQTGAELAALSAGGLAGARQGGQTADELGITGLDKALMIAGYGGAEVLAEKIPFGLGTESAAARRLLGDTVESGVFHFVKDVGTESLEEGATQIAQNAITIGLAPAGAKTPSLMDGVAESMALGAVGGATFGLFNAATSNPSETLPAAQPQPASSPAATPPAPAAPAAPSVDVVANVPFVFDGRQWGRMPNPSVETNVTAPVVPLNPNDPVEGEMIVQMENRRKARERQQQAVAEPPASAPPPVSADTSIQPQSSEPAQAKPAPAKPSKDTLIDPTGDDVITLLRGEIGRIGQITDGPEWDWYRELQKQAAASRLKPQSADAAARRGEIDDPAALLAWINANVVDANGNGRALDEAQQELSELPNRSFAFPDGLGTSILDAIDARAKSRQQGTADDHMAKLEADTIEKEQQQDREFLTLTAKSAGTAMTGDVLSQQVAVGSTVRIGGNDFTVTDFDDSNGTVQLSSPTFGVQDVAADDVIPVEQVDDTPFPLGEATSDESQSWADRVIAESQATPFIGFDPKLAIAYAVKGARLIKEGFTTFTKWAGEMVRRFGEAVRDYLQGAWQAAKKTSRVGAINPSGRAQPLTEPVLTATGEKIMGELSVGDALASIDGEPSTVKAIYPQGEKRVYAITLADGRTVRATEEHLWKCRTNGREHVFRTWEIAALMQSGTVELPTAA